MTLEFDTTTDCFLYEDASFVKIDGQTIEEIRADERRKFAEWLVDCLDCNKTFMNAYIKKYEKEQRGGAE